MSYEPKLISALKEIYSKIDNSWVQQNSLILNSSRRHKLVLGGSIGMAITRKIAIKIPGDIDLFTNSNDDALLFLNDIIKYLHDKKGSYYRIWVNNETKFTLEGVKSHYKILGPPYWKSICIMVLKEPIRSFYWNSARVQFFDDIVKAAQQVTLIDKKDRIGWLDIFKNDEQLNDCSDDATTNSLLLKNESASLPEKLIS